MVERLVYVVNIHKPCLLPSSIRKCPGEPPQVIHRDKQEDTTAFKGSKTALEGNVLIHLNHKFSLKPWFHLNHKDVLSVDYY